MVSPTPVNTYATTTTRTRQQLAEAVLRDALAVVSADETPQQAETEAVGRMYDDALEYMRDEGVADWDSNAIPASVFRSVVQVVAADAAVSYGAPYDPQNKAMGMAQLRRSIAKKASDRPTKIEAF
jgi:hypothetical protein